MLHNNISATQKSYGLEAAQVDVTLLYQEAPKPLFRPVIITPKQLDPDNEALPDSPEQRNILLAKNIVQHRHTLKKMLSEVPLATAWLLGRNDQAQAFQETDATLDGPEPETDQQLEKLAQCYQHAQHSALKYGLNSTDYLHWRQELSAVFCEYPLSAEQLKHLATIVTHAYALQTRENPNCSQADLDIQRTLTKKMQKMAHVNLDKIVLTLRQLEFKPTATTAFNRFLLPPDNQLHTSLRHLIRTEELWLNARHKLAEANARLVLYLANQYKGGFLDFNDLVQEGQSGLLKAEDRFDPQRGFKFSTYAVYWIRQGISRALTRNERVVRLPFGQMANIGKVYRTKEAFFNKTGQEMPLSLLAEQTQLSEAELNNLALISQGTTSLDSPIGEEDSSSTLSDFLEQQIYDHPLNKIAENELATMISMALRTLTKKEAIVICNRFGIHSNTEMTLEEIGQELNLTRERVRQIQAAALQKLKQQFGAELANFL